MIKKKITISIEFNIGMYNLYVDPLKFMYEKTFIITAPIIDKIENTAFTKWTILCFWAIDVRVISNV
jgi:hypothetical protein